MPSNNSNLIRPDTADVETLAEIVFPVCRWLSTVHAATGAGFYGAGGLLPFVFGPAPDEKYFVYRVRRPMGFAEPEVLNNLAWRLAADPNPKMRDGTQAVRLALGACERTHFEKAICIGTLAAAYAQAGKFDDAVAAAQRACELAAKNGETDLLQKNQELLKRYRSHQTAKE